MSEKRISVVDLNTGRTRPVREEKPFLSSALAGWNGFLLEEVRAVEIKCEEVSGTHHVVWLNLDSPFVLDWQGDGRSISKTILPGQTGIGPAHLPFSMHYRTEGSVVRVGLEENFFASATAEVSGLESVVLVWAHGIDDPLIRELVLGLRSEARNAGREGILYAESLAAALAMHLAYKHASQPPKVQDYRGGLTKFQLRKVMEYVREHLSENTSLKVLAEIAGLSPFHFARMFKQSTGMAPHQYLIRSRVRRAKELLLIRNADIADVAARVGFCDQSHLAVHFKRVTGLTPSGFAQRMLPRKSITQTATTQ